MLQLTVPAPERDLKRLHRTPIAPEPLRRGTGCCALVGGAIRCFVDGGERGARVTTMTSMTNSHAGKARSVGSKAMTSLRWDSFMNYPIWTSARSVTVRFKE